VDYMSAVLTTNADGESVIWHPQVFWSINPNVSEEYLRWKFSTAKSLTYWII
jgi:hypothetical protein